jgi:hypothetical protein
MVLIGLVFVGLLALSGLAIDGGYLFVQRRQAQNAADAAALAGTRLVAGAIQTCDTIDLAALDAEIDRTINRYAEQNEVSDTNGIAGDEVNDNVVGHYVGVDGASLGQVGEMGTLPIGTAGVRVEVVDAHETFFLPVLGIKEIPSSAPAMAFTGPVTQSPGGTPILPIAVPDIVVGELKPGDEWEVHDDLDGEFCYPPDDEDQVCIEDPGAPDEAQRGWLNLNHIFNTAYISSTDELNRTFERNASDAGCPNKPGELPGLKGYASADENGVPLCPYPHPIFAGPTGSLDGDWIHGSSGAKEAALITIQRDICTKDEQREILAPVFDTISLTVEMVDQFGAGAECPDGYPNGGGFSTAGGATYYYHIVGYVKVACGGKKPEKHTLSGEFVEAKVEPGDITVLGYSGSGTCSPLVHGVVLWE